MKRTRKKVPWTGWNKLAPSAKQRTAMKHTCGKNVFLDQTKVSLFVQNAPVKYIQKEFMLYILEQELTEINTQNTNESLEPRKNCYVIDLL